MSDDTLFHCGTCYQREQTPPSGLEKRNETTKVFKPDGIYVMAVCHRCGGLMKPALREIDEDQL